MASTQKGVMDIRWSALVVMAAVLNGFAFVTVNWWIYTARWDFIERNSDQYHEPPTISRAISDPVIGEPFSFWITVSGVCLFFGVLFLMVEHYRVMSRMTRSRPAIWLGWWLILPAVLLLQAISGVGMNILSSFRFPDFHEMHMTGSYLFFISQALVVLLYTFFNTLLLRDPQGLREAEELGALSRRWIRVRVWGGWAAVGLVCVYFALFIAKDHSDNATLYLAYVSTEPLVITGFLVVLGLAHVDLIRRQ